VSHKPIVVPAFTRDPDEECICTNCNAQLTRKGNKLVCPKGCDCEVLILPPKTKREKLDDLRCKDKRHAEYEIQGSAWCPLSHPMTWEESDHSWYGTAMNRLRVCEITGKTVVWNKRCDCLDKYTLKQKGAST